LEVGTFLKNQNGPRSTYLCGDLASFVGTASRTIQIAQVYRDPVYPALVTVNGKADASLNVLSQFLIPADVPRSDGDLHRYLL
jgi:hypothetical protein